MNVLIVASEVYPFAKTGGLADVIGALPKELAKEGINVKVVMPRYYIIDKNKYNLKSLDGALGVPMGVLGELWCEVYESKMPNSNVEIYFIEYEEYFGRSEIYNDENGKGFSDNDNRFIFLSKASLQLCKKLHFKPDVIHINDWQTSPIATFVNSTYKNDSMFKDSATLLSIHNIQYQGEFYKGVMDVLGVGWEHFNHNELEYYDGVNLLKGAICVSDVIITVSQKYAKEIQTSEYGYGLEGVISSRSSDVFGIVNGVDYEEWSPENDTYLKANYSVDDLEGKAICKADLQEIFGLPKADVPIVGMVTRLADQKGIDVVMSIIGEVLNLELQIVLVGSGDKNLQEFFINLAKERKNFKCYIGYSNELAHKVEAGSDFFLMPSRFEPCGLNQMYSLRYGTLPIVRATGGLDDTIENFDEVNRSGDGFKFYDLTNEALYNTIGWALNTYYNDKVGMQSLITNAMKKEFTWKKSAKEYIRLYELAIERKREK